MNQRDHARILIYSHDTYGLSRTRRCLAVANALVGQFKGLFVLIISGAQLPSGMGLRARVDFVKIPSIIKLYDGHYTSMEEHIDLRDTLAMRQSIVHNTAEAFDPDLMIVDGAPLGPAPEIEDTVEHLRAHGCTIVMALADLIDADDGTMEDLDPNEATEDLDRLYDRIWVYGVNRFAEPFSALDVPASLAEKITYAGYLRRNIPRGFATLDLPFTNPYILVMTDDSNDDPELLDCVLTAYETDRTLPHPALLILSPLLPAADRKVIRGRVSRLDNVRLMDFEEGSGALMPGAVGVVTTAEYDALCQVLSFDKRAIFVVREGEQSARTVRAKRAEKMSLAVVLEHEAARDAAVMAKALHTLANQPLPSQAGATDMLTGLETICAQVEALTAQVQQSSS